MPNNRVAWIKPIPIISYNLCFGSRTHLYSKLFHPHCLTQPFFFFPFFDLRIGTAVIMGSAVYVAIYNGYASDTVY